MAGKRQHYLAKYLQREFLARNHPPEKGECTWWHFRGNPAKLLKISRLAVIRLSCLTVSITRSSPSMQPTPICLVLLPRAMC